MSKSKSKVNLVGVGKLALQATAGATLAIIFSKVVQLIEGRTEEYHLRKKPENFDVDQNASKLFSRLEKWAHFDEENYDKCFDATDGLLLIEKELKKPDAAIDVEDIARAEQLFKMALAYAHAFILTIKTQYQDEVTPKEIVRLEYEIQKIDQFLGAHLVSIFSLASLL